MTIPGGMAAPKRAERCVHKNCSHNSAQTCYTTQLLGAHALCYVHLILPHHRGWVKWQKTHWLNRQVKTILTGVSYQSALPHPSPWCNRLKHSNAAGWSNLQRLRTQTCAGLTWRFFQGMKHSPHDCALTLTPSKISMWKDNINKQPLQYLLQHLRNSLHAKRIFILRVKII